MADVQDFHKHGSNLLVKAGVACMRQRERLMEREGENGD